MLLAAPIANAQSASSVAANPHSPPLKLDLPRWLPLTAAQIVRAFAGRTLVVDEDFQPYPGVRVVTFRMGGCPPSETFSADGVWTRYECLRGPRTYTGHWTTEKFRGGERLCVQAPDFIKSCRFVWQGSAGDRFIMAADHRASRQDQDDPHIFNPYRLLAPKG